MCGISGYFGHFDRDCLERMTAAQVHRGPDDGGVWVDAAAGIGLGHRRLSIIDLSPAGHQPMWDATRRACIAFNGEIYNYRELRAELARDGFIFNSHSDTEVILNLWLRDGEAAFAKLNGIFAFALWDPARRQLICARDAFGTKPFYWTETSAGWLFASEIKAFLDVPGFCRDLNPQAISAYMALLYAPGEATAFKRVRKLLPGHSLVFENGKAPVVKCFKAADLAVESIAPMTEADAIDQCRGLLAQAVKRQLVADVPVGGFLSGGLDSSAIAWEAARSLAAPSDYACFTIGFNTAGTSEEGFAEDLPYAHRVAQKLGVPLHTVRVGAELADELDFMVRHLDEPIADPAALNTYHICRLAREHGIKVLLSGAGGDDLFTGYRRHVAVDSEKWWGGLPTSVRRALRSGTSRLPVGSSAGRRLAKLFRYADRSPDARLAGYFVWMEDSRIRRLLNPDFIASMGAWAPADTLVETLRELPAGVPRLNQMLHLDQRHFLTDQNLNYTDKLSMATGVEVRVPFLDNDLAAFAARLPLQYKQRGRCGKWVLKKAMEGRLDSDVIYRPKSGFGVPLRRWIHGEYRVRFNDLIDSGRLDATGVFSGAAVRALIEEDRAGRVDATYPLYAVLCIESWLRTFAKI